MDYARKISFLGLILGVSLLFPRTTLARKVVNLPDRPFLFYLAGDLALTSNKADAVAGAQYSKNMRTPLVATLGLGGYLFSYLWIGARYERWFTSREFLLEGVSEKNSLNLQMVGPEVAYVRKNPRIAYLFAVGGLYPFEQKISSLTQVSFTRGTRFWNYYARASMELKVTSRLAFHLEAGYHWLNLRDLKSNGVSFVSEGGDLNLSGPFAGMGLGIMF